MGGCGSRSRTWNGSCVSKVSVSVRAEVQRLPDTEDPLASTFRKFGTVRTSTPPCIRRQSDRDDQDAKHRFNGFLDQCADHERERDKHKYDRRPGISPSPVRPCSVRLCAAQYYYSGTSRGVEHVYGKDHVRSELLVRARTCQHDRPESLRNDAGARRSIYRVNLRQRAKEQPILRHWQIDSRARQHAGREAPEDRDEYRERDDWSPACSKKSRGRCLAHAVDPSQFLDWQCAQIDQIREQIKDERQE